jgi:hypothetical protein
MSNATATTRQQSSKGTVIFIDIIDIIRVERNQLET